LAIVIETKSHSEAGFTLTEILIVLVIIALMSSVVILTIPPPKSDLETQVEMMVGALNRMSQNSLITGRVSAAGFSSEGFGLYDYVNGEWEETFTDGWHDSYRLQFEREEAKLDLPKTTAPSILFHPTGLSTPFELAMSNGQTEYVLEASGNGRVVLRKSQ